MKKDRVISALLLMAFFIVPALIGCGKGSGTVQGKVSLGGEPLIEGKVIFTSPDKLNGGTGDITPDGSYVCDLPIPVGEYKVAVTPPYYRPLTPDEPSRKAVTDIPEIYQTFEETPLRFTVKRGENTADFDVPFE